MENLPKTAKGIARLATAEDIAKEDSKYVLAADNDSILLSDVDDILIPNLPDFGYTHPNLHRRIDLEAVGSSETDYPFMPRDKDGIPYNQNIVIGVWDGLHSYRTTETYTHDEESTTCEIP